MTLRFFVYGSMCEGMVHFSKISNFIEKSLPAAIQASAWRLRAGFPALMRDGMDWVEGQWVELRGGEMLLALLDEFHGYNAMDPAKSLYLRERRSVSLGDRLEDAWVYFLNPLKKPVGAIPIPGGNWKRSLQEQPPLVSKLTERQRCYLLKLGAASGRDIVPINDMSLYRELMNLELIVDKGRRLALSKLGQEVYRHLV